MRSSKTVSPLSKETGRSAPIPPSPILRTLIQNTPGVALPRPLSRTLIATLYLGYARTASKDSPYRRGSQVVVALGQVRRRGSPRVLLFDTAFLSGGLVPQMR